MSTIDKHANPTDTVGVDRIAVGDHITWRPPSNEAHMTGVVRCVSASFYVAMDDSTGACHAVRRGQATREEPL